MLVVLGVHAVDAFMGLLRVDFRVIPRYLYVSHISSLSPIKVKPSPTYFVFSIIILLFVLFTIRCHLLQYKFPKVV